MRVRQNISLLVLGVLLAAMTQARSQSLSQDLSQSQQPSEQQIEAFCANWGQLSGSQKKQYREQYERYCRDEPVFGRPVAPQQQQEPRKPQKPEKPQKPAAPEEPEPPEPAEPEPQIQPAKPEPVIPEPEPLRVDLVGELALAGPLARQPGERQRLRVTVANRGSDSPAGNQLWARVFLSDREVSRQGASAGAFAFAGERRGRPLRLPGVPGPDRSRAMTTEITLPAGTPDGNYWWCVRLDTRQQVEETNEGNNTACVRKVVALGKDDDSELSGVFGSKVAGLNEPDTAVQVPEVARNLRVELPDYVQPLMDEVPVLTVNGSDPMAPVTVGEGDSAVAAWDFPEESEVDEIFLRVHDDPFVGGCPAPGTSRSAGRAELESCPACRIEADDGFRDDASGWHNLQLGEYYETGSVYYLQACGLAGGTFNGTQTNTVTMGYGTTPPGTMAAFPVDPSLVAGLGDAGVTGLPEMPEVPVQPPDFIVRHIGVSKRPGSDGQLLIRISDQSGRWFDYLSERRDDALSEHGDDLVSRGTVHTDGWLVPMPITIKVNGVRLTRPPSSDTPSETYGGDHHGVYSDGYFPDASFAVLIPPTGEAVVRVPREMYELPADGKGYRIEVSINLPGDDAVIPETTTVNNTDSRELRRELPVMSVGVLATRFRVDTVGESDQESLAEMREIQLRVCNERTGACSDWAKFYSGRDEIHDGSGDPADPVEVSAGDDLVIVPDPDRLYVEVPGTREDWFYLKVYAFESDPCSGLARSCGASGTGATKRSSFRVPAEEAASSGADPCPVFEPSLGGWAESGSSKGPHLTPLNAVVRVCYPATE